MISRFIKETIIGVVWSVAPQNALLCKYSRETFHDYLKFLNDRGPSSFPWQIHPAGEDFPLSSESPFPDVLAAVPAPVPVPGKPIPNHSASNPIIPSFRYFLYPIHAIKTNAPTSPRKIAAIAGIPGFKSL